MSAAGINFTAAHKWSERPFRCKLTCHDSAVLTCRGQDAPYICQEVIARSMSINNVIPLLNFSFGIEMGLHTRYSVKSGREELEAIGVPEGYKPVDVEACEGPSGGSKNPYPTAHK